ncbi:MotE family protein [Gracilibacillus sp. HCP3S3_G5_1]|uniref:MotE family protein n=1 Tax=unclassified Gracilibacillus TaxID=2625209 RepID=UPI003F89E8EE
MTTNPKKNKEKKPSVFQWLIVIFVPLILALLLTVIILMVMGVDVGKYTKETLNKVPFLADYVTTDAEELHANQLAEKDHQINQLQEEIDALQYELQSKDGTITELEEEIAEMSSQIADIEELEENDPVSSDSFKELAASFAAMKPKTAAPIIETMANNVAIPLLRELDSEDRGKILGQMDPEIAATYADLLVSE